MYEWYIGTVILLLDLRIIIICPINLFSNIHADADDAVVQVGTKKPTRLYIEQIVNSNIFQIFVMI